MLKIKNGTFSLNESAQSYGVKVASKRIKVVATSHSQD
ncbi:hypothetical protein J2X69_002435 [Algoriphagus sp. 4150]|nr:hypothetical protein [Algoriphagus sp. 4150]